MVIIIAKPHITLIRLGKIKCLNQYRVDVICIDVYVLITSF